MSCGVYTHDHDDDDDDVIMHVVCKLLIQKRQSLLPHSEAADADAVAVTNEPPQSLLCCRLILY